MRRLAALLLALGAAGCASWFMSPGQKFSVFFTPLSSQLDANATAAVAGAASWARRYPNQTLTVVGYTDPRINRQLNEELALRRAQAVADQLVRDGVPIGRVTPATGDATILPLALQADRRVDISFAPP